MACRYIAVYYEGDGGSISKIECLSSAASTGELRITLPYSQFGNAPEWAFSGDSTGYNSRLLRRGGDQAAGYALIGGAVYPISAGPNDSAITAGHRQLMIPNS